MHRTLLHITYGMMFPSRVHPCLHTPHNGMDATVLCDVMNFRILETHQYLREVLNVTGLSKVLMMYSQSIGISFQQ